MKKHLAGLLVAAVTVATSGCARYYVVESSFVASDIKESPANVTLSSSAPDIAGARAVAVKAPDVCISESESQKTGEARGAAQVMKVQCGVEMSQIESALARQGFNVISWKVLQNALKVADVQTSTHLQAASNLGADVLLQINSMERSYSSPGNNARWDRRYKKAKSSGAIKGDAAVTPAIAEQLNALIVRSEKGSIPADRLSATINASAVDVQSGRAFWFYDWNNIENKEKSEIKVSQLARCKGEICFSHRDQGKSLNPMSKKKLVSGDSQAVTTGPRPKELERAQHELLIKEAIDDMIKNFAAM